jgi:hypothetical protein
MANEMVQGLLQNLLQPTQGPNPADIMAAISSRNPMASVAAMQAPQLSQMFGQQFRGLVGGLTGRPAPLTANEAYTAAVQQLSAQPDFMNSSESLAQLAKAASAVGRTQEAMQFSLLASQAREQEAAKTTNTAKTQLQIGTLLNYLDETAAAAPSEASRAAILAFKNPVASGAIQADQLNTALKPILESFKVEAPKEKADVKDFEFPSGTVLSLKVDEQGNVNYQNQWQDPSSLGLRSAAGRSQSAVATKEDNRLDPLAIRGLIEEQTARGNLPADPNDPIAKGFMDQVNGGLITTPEQANKYFENLPNTPAYNQKQAQISNNIIQGVAPSLRNMQQVFTILNDPKSRIGSTWSYTEDYRLGTDAQRLKDALLPVVSDASYQQILQLKAQSAELGGQGTGYGAVTTIEFESLQNRLENLKTSRTVEDLQEAANDYMVHTLNIRNAAAKQPIAVINGDPTYIGMPIEAAPAGANFDGYLIMNGQRIPINVYENADQYLSTVL